MRKLILLSVLALLSCSLSAARFLTAPYLQNLTPTEVTICWVADDATGMVGYVQYRGKGETNKCAYSTERGMVVAYNRINRVRLTGLKPGTEYAYSVIEKSITNITDTSLVYGDSVQSSQYKFTTPKEDQYTVRCKIFNDIHDNHLLTETALKNTSVMPDFDFVFYNGDMLNAVPSETNIISNLIKPSTDLFASNKPFYMVKGNHEVRREMARKVQEYTFMGNQERGYYTFTYGPCFFIVLDSSEDAEDEDADNLFAGDIYRREQAQWLEQVLQSDEKKNALYTVVFKHIPTYTNTSKERHGMIYERQLYQPLFHKYGIDVLISGHTHIPGIYPADSNHQYPLVIGGGNTTTTGANDYPTITTLSANRYQLQVKIFTLGGKEKYTLTIPNSKGLPELDGDLMVLRLGDSTASLNTRAAYPLFIDEYHLSQRQATLTNSLALPTVADGNQHRCTGTGSTMTSGFMTRSEDGQYLLVSGYDAAVGEFPVAASAADFPRVVARVDYHGDINTTTALTDVYHQSDFRCAASPDGQTIYVSGAGGEANKGGVYCAQLGDSTATLLSGSYSNTKNIRLYGGHLYTATDTTLLDETYTSILPATPAASDALDFCLVQLDATGDEKVLYWINGQNSISKYSLVKGEWVFNSTLTDIARPRSMTAQVTDDCVRLFVVSAANTATGSSKLTLLEDVGGYNAAIDCGVTVLLDATGTRTSLRSVAWKPQMATGVRAIKAGETAPVNKVLINGQIYILKDNKIYSILGLAL